MQPTSQKQQILGILEEMVNNVSMNAGTSRNSTYQLIEFGKERCLVESISRIQKGVPDDDWISVDERLPEFDTDVLTYDGFDREVAKLWEDCGWVDSREHMEKSVTHWQHLPPTPISDN